MRRMGKKVKSHEERRILLLGETVKENPRTILLSIPIFFFGLLFYSLIGDGAGVAVSLGHCGISFKNYHRHYWQKDFLLKIAYFLFDKSSQYATGEGKVSDFLHCGKTALALGDSSLALKKYGEALKEARRIRHQSIAGNIYAHMAAVELERKSLSRAKEYLVRAHKILDKSIKEKPNSLYIHIWLSGAELISGEYCLAKGDKEVARVWAKKAESRAMKYNLKVRKLDANKLLEKIGK